MKKVSIILLLFTNILFAQNVFSNNYKIVKSIKSLNSKNYQDVNELQYAVYNNDKHLYTVKRNIDYDIPHPGAVVMGEGKLVLVNSFDASIEVYDINGSFIKTVNLLEDREVTYERSIYFDSEANKIALLISQSEYEKSTVVILNKDGQSLAQWDAEFKNASGIKFSIDAEIVAVSGYNWFHNLEESTMFYSSEGELNYSLSEKFSKGYFQGNYFVGITNKTAFYVETTSGKMIWKKVTSSGELFSDVSFDGSKVILLVTDNAELKNGSWIYSKLQLDVIDAMGKTVERKNIYNEAFEEYSISKVNDKTNISVNKKIVYSE